MLNTTWTLLNGLLFLSQPKQTAVLKCVRQRVLGAWELPTEGSNITVPFGAGEIVVLVSFVADARVSCGVHSYVIFINMTGPHSQ